MVALTTNTHSLTHSLTHRQVRIYKYLSPQVIELSKTDGNQVPVLRQTNCGGVKLVNGIPITLIDNCMSNTDIIKDRIPVGIKILIPVNPF